MITVRAFIYDELTGNTLFLFSWNLSFVLILVVYLKGKKLNIIQSLILSLLLCNQHSFVKTVISILFPMKLVCSGSDLGKEKW